MSSRETCNIDNCIYSVEESHIVIPKGERVLTEEARDMDPEFAGLEAKHWKEAGEKEAGKYCIEHGLHVLNAYI